VTPGSLDAGNVSAGNLWEWDGQLYVIYHASSGKSFARPIDQTLTTVGAPVLLHQSSGFAPDVGRVASPEIVADGDTVYLFYEQGARLDATIAYATADVSTAPFALAVTRSAVVGCSADGLATLAVTVTVTNDSTAPNDIRITTAIGERKLTGVASHVSRTITFTATSAELTAGTATVKAFARVGGIAYEQTWPLEHPGRSG